MPEVEKNQRFVVVCRLIKCFIELENTVPLSEWSRHVFTLYISYRLSLHCILRYKFVCLVLRSLFSFILIVCSFQIQEHNNKISRMEQAIQLSCIEDWELHLRNCICERYTQYQKKQSLYTKECTEIYFGRK